MPAVFPRAVPSRLDSREYIRVRVGRVGGTVFAFAFTVTTAALLVFGLAPALRMSRTAPADVLRSGDRASTVGRTVKRLRDMMVVVQVAAALVLVAGSLLLTRSFDSLLSVPLGVEPAPVAEPSEIE